MTSCLSTLRAIALATLLIFAALLVRRRWASRYVTLEQVEKLEKDTGFKLRCGTPQTVGPGGPST